MATKIPYKPFVCSKCGAVATSLPGNKMMVAGMSGNQNYGAHRHVWVPRERK
jgi:hypothetical protein